MQSESRKAAPQASQPPSKASARTLILQLDGREVKIHCILPGITLTDVVNQNHVYLNW